MILQEDSPYQLEITDSHSSKRLDSLLAELFPEQSRAYFQKLIESEHVLLNQKSVKKREVPKVGDIISIDFVLNQEISLEPEEIPLNIIYEDEYLLCVNKPPFLVVHPAPGHWRGTLANGLLYYFSHLELPSTDPIRPGIVHRLDKDTSGLILIAKTLPTHRKLIELFSERKIEKSYLAICSSTPKESFFEGELGRDPKERKKQKVLPKGEGRPSYTSFEILTQNDAFSFVKAKPKTGRTHQIRVHLRELNSPILGDPIYGHAKLNKKYPNTRLQLHAYKLCFKHPITEKPIALIAPIPDDMSQLVKHLFPGYSYESTSTTSRSS